MEIRRLSLAAGIRAPTGVCVVIDVIRSFSSAPLMVHLGARRLVLETDVDRCFAMRDATIRRDRCIGSLLGCGLGDAIGELAFAHPGETALGEAVAAAGRLSYTDDTAMTIALAEALTTDGAIDPQGLGDRFAAHHAREPWRGYGPGPPALFRTVAAGGLSYLDAARHLYGGVGSYGNGAAMRTAPIALAFGDSAALYDQADAGAAVTHAHPVGRDGAAVQALAIALALEADPDEGLAVAAFADRLVAAARTTEIREKMAQVRVMLGDGTGPTDAANRIGRGIAVQESMPFAVYAFLKAPQSFAGCLRIAVLNGGDRDTLGAMAGAIAGAHLGARRLPPDWLGKLENRALIEDLGARLAERFAP